MAGGRPYKRVKNKKSRSVIDWPVVDEKKAFEVRTMHIQNDCMAMILAGRSEREINEFLLNKYGLKELWARTMREKAEEQLIKRKEWEMGTVINVHLNRYEEIYGKLVELGATGMAGTALKSKERLLQFHKQSTHLKVANNNITQISIREQKSGFDVDKLDPDKKKRLMELVSRTVKQ